MQKSRVRKPMDRQLQINEWSRLYGRQITEKEYREVCDNLKCFFEILHEWDNRREEISNRH